MLDQVLDDMESALVPLIIRDWPQITVMWGKIQNHGGVARLLIGTDELGNTILSLVNNQSGNVSGFMGVDFDPNWLNNPNTLQIAQMIVNPLRLMN